MELTGIRFGLGEIPKVVLHLFDVLTVMRRPGADTLQVDMWKMILPSGVHMLQVDKIMVETFRGENLQ